jgi:outer membrane lipase/esterase
MARVNKFASLVFIFALFAAMPVAAEQKVDDLVVFGDSLSDPGNAFALLGEQSLPPFLLIPEAPYGIGGHHFTNGRTWVETLGYEFGLAVGPAFSPQGRFNNYAIGAARARSYGQIYLSMQVATYLGRNNSKASAQNIYVLFIGGNDVRDAIETFAADPSGGLASQVIGNALAAVGDNISALASAGARRFLVLNVPDLSLVPAIRLQGAQAQKVAALLSNEYNKGLAQVLVNLQDSYSAIELKTLDTFALLHDVVENPGEYDMKNVVDSCITPGVIIDAICAKPEKYLFWDGIHPTQITHKLISESVIKLYKDTHKHGEKEDQSRYAKDQHESQPARHD